LFDALDDALGQRRLIANLKVVSYKVMLRKPYVHNAIALYEAARRQENTKASMYSVQNGKYCHDLPLHLAGVLIWLLQDRDIAQGQGIGWKLSILHRVMQVV
jgi:hypothetical protein